MQLRCSLYTPWGYVNRGPEEHSALARSVALFVVAGLMEIGGGYLVRLCLREHRGFILGALGAREEEIRVARKPNARVLL